MIYLLTRHEGTLEWLQQQISPAQPFVHICHLESPEQLQAGDHIYGNLPLDRVAMLNARGVNYSHLVITVPFHLRGQELSAEQLDTLGARLQEYRVLALSPLAHLLED